MSSKIQIMELFGPTIQGEGIMTGTITHFLRTGGCGLRCSWCDSLFAVLPEEIKKHRRLMTTAEILDEIQELKWAPYITFTGGDPCIQPLLGDMIPILNLNRIRVAVETQGQHFPDWLRRADVVTFSPKGPSSGNIVDISDLIDWLVERGSIRTLKVCIKVVCFDRKDFEYALDVYDRIPESYYDAFYMTAGTPQNLKQPEERVLSVLMIQQALADDMLKETGHFNSKVHLGCQQHVLLWPDKSKGV